MKLVAGIDIGSGATKAVLMDEEGAERGAALVRTRNDLAAMARDAFTAALDAAGADEGEVAYVSTTGLGRYAVPFRNLQITDLTCSAKGVTSLLPDVRFVLDMGAQSTRATRISERGKVEEFVTNEKCAAGSGTFLNRVAKYLEVKVEELGEMPLDATSPQPISSVCAVLAESEIINHVSEGVKVGDIVCGVYVSLADRALSQLRRVGMSGPVAFVGGVALQRGMVKVCEERFGVPVLVSERPRLVAARGAAILGWQRLRKLAASGVK